MQDGHVRHACMVMGPENGERVMVATLDQTPKVVARWKGGYCGDAHAPMLTIVRQIANRDPVHWASAGFVPQISAMYPRMDRSDENQPDRAVFSAAMRPHAAGSA